MFLLEVDINCLKQEHKVRITPFVGNGPLCTGVLC